ncbi:MAG: hypothetical protein ACO32I_04675 [Candidatus Limnocylindrus sp.]
MDKTKLEQLVADAGLAAEHVRVSVEEEGTFRDLLHHFPVAANQLSVRVLADALDALRDKDTGAREAQLRVAAAELAHASLCVWRSSDEQALTRVGAYALVLPALMGYSRDDIYRVLLAELPCIGAWVEVLRDVAGEDEEQHARVSYAARAAWMRWCVDAAEGGGGADVVAELLIQAAQYMSADDDQLFLTLPNGSVEVDGVRLASEGQGTSVWLDGTLVASSQLLEGGIIGTDVPNRLSDKERARIAQVFEWLFGTRADYVMSVAVPSLR